MVSINLKQRLPTVVAAHLSGYGQLIATRYYQERALVAFESILALILLNVDLRLKDPLWLRQFVSWLLLLTSLLLAVHGPRRNQDGYCLLALGNAIGAQMFSLGQKPTEVYITVSQCRRMKCILSMYS